MTMTTPNEFLQFAKDMGLGTIKSPLSSIQSPSISNYNGYTTTGLSVLNNLCRLIEQIHQLKSENNRLRAHLDLVENVDKFQQNFLLKDIQEYKKHNQKNEEIFSTISPTNSLKLKQSKSTRDQKGINYGHHQEDSPPILHTDPDQSELIDNTSGVSSARTWNRVRHALKFSLRRKHGSSNTPPLTHIDRQIPTISISIESDDDHLQDNKHSLKKKKKTVTTNDNQNMNIGEDTDQDDESIQFVRAYHKRRLYGNETPTSSSTERHETSSANVPFNTSNIDEEVFLTRKLSKIARYRRKLRSKFDTVKKQFSDQNPSSTRFISNSQGLTFDDIGLGLNQSLLKAQLAPALTKSYQEKMRAWQTIQKSDFLVNYRRQSILPKLDLNPASRKTSVKEPSQDSTIPQSTIDNCSSIVDELNLELETNLQTLGPILSSNQRSLIVHQWREIMSEEISLRHYNEYLQNRMILLKKLETNLKTLKTNIFCTNYILKQQSMINISEIEQYNNQRFLPQRCRSLQSLVSIPASWILAVQSAAYSDVLDGTSSKTTERAFLFNKNFFEQLENFKRDRQKFEQDSIKNLQLLTQTKNKNENRLNKSRVKFVLTRGCLRKLSLISYSEFPQYFLPDPIIPLQTTISQAQPQPITNEIDSKTQLSLSSGNINKRSKRSLFDFKKTYQRSRSVCLTQINSWFHRRRQGRHVSAERQQSPAGSRLTTPSSTPKLLGSPRLARLHQKLFKHQTASTSKIEHTSQILDDSDNRSQYDLPVRIYLPPLTTPASRHVRITDINIHQGVEIEQTSNLTSPIIHRKYSSSSSSSSSPSPSLRKATAKERRESFATLSNIFHNKFL